MSAANFLTQLVIPINFAAVLLLLATLLLFIKKRKAAIIALLVAGFWVLFWSIPIASVWLGGHLENRYPATQANHAPTADLIVVLGGHTANNRNNWFDRYDKTKTTSRIQYATALYLAQRASLVLVSGAALDGGTSEAQTMATHLKQHGVSEKNILIEESSYTTKENAYYSAKIIKHLKSQQHPVDQVLLVTSALHMSRAMASFKKEGVTPIAAPVAPQITRPEQSWGALWQPSLHTLHASRSIIKEYAGLLVYWLRGWI